MNADRNAIRRQMRQRRRGLPPGERRTRDRHLTRELTRSALFRNSRHVAFYLPNDGEADLRPALAVARAMGKHCYLPVLSPLFHNRLWFCPYPEDAPMRANRFGIPEPVGRWRHMRPAWALDLILTPLVAFDARGNRLGMGGGFYDRTLAYLFRRRYWRKPDLLGVAYGFQECEELPRASWDVPLAGVMTDTGLVEAR